LYFQTLKTKNNQFEIWEHTGIPEKPEIMTKTS